MIGWNTFLCEAKSLMLKGEENPWLNYGQKLWFLCGEGLWGHGWIIGSYYWNWKIMGEINEIPFQRLKEEKKEEGFQK